MFLVHLVACSDVLRSRSQDFPFRSESEYRGIFFMSSRLSRNSVIYYALVSKSRIFIC